MKRIYVAGALNSDSVGYIKNMHQMIKWADELKKLKFSVFVPCLDFLMGVVNGNYEYDDYFINSQEWLRVSDYVFVCPGWENSKGTKKEIELAEIIDKPVFYSLQDLLDHRAKGI
jgi:hypothetical protein